MANARATGTQAEPVYEITVGKREMAAIIASLQAASTALDKRIEELPESLQLASMIDVQETMNSLLISFREAREGTKTMTAPKQSKGV